MAHVWTREQHVQIHMGVCTLHRCTPRIPLHTRPPPPALPSSAWAPHLSQEPNGLFVVFSCSCCLSLLCLACSPPGQLLSPCQDASRAPPLSAADAGLLRASCRAGPGEEGRDGVEPAAGASPGECQTRSVLASWPSQREHLGKQAFQFPSAGSCSSSSPKLRI